MLALLLAGFSSGRQWVERTCPYIKEAYACDSKHYLAFFSSLPPFDLGRLELPANTRLLLYGSSFLGQVTTSILCNNPTPTTVQHYNCLANNRAPPMSRAVTSALGLGNGPAAFTAYLPGNTSVTSVINCEAAQDTTNMSLVSHSMSILDKHVGGFTHVAFMRPWPPCFFNFKRARRRGEESFPCVRLFASHAAESREQAKAQEQACMDKRRRCLRRRRKCDKQLRRCLAFAQQPRTPSVELQQMDCSDLLYVRAALRGSPRMAQVASWRETEMDDGGPLPLCDASLGGPVLLGHVLRSHHAVCNHDPPTPSRQCSPDEPRPLGHQCQPGGIEYAAEAVLQGVGLLRQPAHHDRLRSSVPTAAA